jgi:sulfur carrier protein ThiS
MVIGNMAVVVQGSGVLAKHIAPGTVIDDAHTVGEAVSQLDLPEVGELIMIVNGRIAYWHTALADGDTLRLVPGVSGGERFPT